MHQRKAFWFSYPLEASMLAVTMGGGKTKIAIDLMQNWQSRNVLIISPLRACEDAWLPQLDQHIVGTANVAEVFWGTAQRRLNRTLDVMDTPKDRHAHRITLINHEAFWREPMRTYAVGRTWDLIIVDESHREKGAGSKQSQFLSRLGLQAERRLCLTGTPMPHSPLDVYGQYRFLDRGIYGTNFADFQGRYSVFGGFQNRQVVDFVNLEELNQKFFSIGIKIDDSEQGLPRVVDIEHKVKLEPHVRKIYDAIDKKFIAEIRGGEATIANSGVKILRLHQLACGIMRTDDKKTMRVGRVKLDALREIVGDLPETEPLVVFTRFKSDTRRIWWELDQNGVTASELSGEQNELAEWKAGETRVLVAQIQAAKEGIDLTRAAIAVFYSTGVSLGDYEQCRKRLHRPPQKRMVRFIHILASGTRDITTMRSLKERRDVVRDALTER